MITAVKDSMTAKAAQLYFNSQIARYSRLTSVKIDSKNKTMELTGHLHGDRDSLAIRVTRYAIEKVEGKYFIQAADFTGSRAWLQKLLEDFARERRVEIPSLMGAAL